MLHYPGDFLLEDGRLRALQHPLDENSGVEYVPEAPPPSTASPPGGCSSADGGSPPRLPRPHSFSALSQALKPAIKSPSPVGRRSPSVRSPPPPTGGSNLGLGAGEPGGASSAPVSVPTSRAPEPLDLKELSADLEQALASKFAALCGTPPQKNKKGGVGFMAGAAARPPLAPVSNSAGSTSTAGGAA